MSLFHHPIQLPEIDPLGGGLAEDIIAEQESPEAITLDETPNGDALAQEWGEIVDDLEKDPNWFNFAEED